MFALVIIFAFALAAVLGVVMFVVVCALCVKPRLRRLGLAMIGWGLAGSAFSFALFALLVINSEHSREPIFSQVGAMFVAAGFGVVCAVRGTTFLGARILRLPNRWADRRRHGPPPNKRLERP
jgi:hypothetical protein